MQTSGLLIHLTAEAPDATEARLGARDGLVLGERVERALPAVLEAEDGRASAAAVRALEGVDGVGRVDVVFIGDA